MIGEIENAILARLKTAGETPIEAGGLGYRYKTLDSYPAEFDRFLEENPVLGFPAAWVTFGGYTSMSPVGAGAYQVEAAFVLVVSAENLRNEKAQRHGAAGKAGSYQLALDAIALLADQDLGLEIGGLRPDSLRFVRPSELMTKRKISLLAIPITTTFILERGAPLDMGEFETFHANWDVPPFGGVDADAEAEGVQLPADGQADTSQHLNLRPEEA